MTTEINTIKITGKEQDAFLHGKCLIYAQKLASIFPGYIIFLPEYYHFVFCSQNKLYDASGNVTITYADAKKVRLDNVPEKILKQYKTYSVS